MRRLSLILLLVFTVSLHLARQENLSEKACFATEAVELSEGDVRAGQWLCEYVYNSDLSPASVLQEAEEAHAAVFMFQRGGQDGSRAAILSMCCVTYGMPGVARLVAWVHGKGFAAGMQATDHYLFRLRRLII